MFELEKSTRSLAKSVACISFHGEYEKTNDIKPRHFAFSKTERTTCDNLASSLIFLINWLRVYWIFFKFLIKLQRHAPLEANVFPRASCYLNLIQEPIRCQTVSGREYCADQMT